MNFLRGFIIFASLAMATIQARGSTRPDDYVKGEEELDFNSKVLLEAIRENKEQIMTQNKLMDEKIEHLCKIVIEEKNSKAELQKELNQRIIKDEKELSQLKSKIVELNQSVNEEKKGKSILEKENCELKKRIIKDEKEIINLKSTIVELNQSVNEEKNNKTVLQEKDLELNERIQECCGEIFDRDGTENIFQASEMGSLNGVKFWHCRDPSSIYAKDEQDSNKTPLHYASYYGHLPIVEFLLSKGVDVDAENSYNITPLMHASFNGYVPIVKALLDKGAKINYQDKYKWTALNLAVWDNNNLPLVKLLIERGADRSLRNFENRTPLDWARELGCKSIVDYLSSL